MAQSEALISTLKRELKARNMTYADVANGLSMSEANIKRLFASKRFTLDRLESICRLMNMDLIDLMRSYEESRNQITYLSHDQEKELVSNIRLLLVAVCARNHLSFNQIIESYDISQAECIQYLARLDQLHLIELLPNNRIRLRVSEDFHWLPNGPIENLFRKKMQPEFLNSDFSETGQLRFFVPGLLSQSSRDVVIKKLHKLASEFKELHQQDIPITGIKNNSGLFVAFRSWEFSLFQEFRR
ncbi:MAG: helix-turn-helix domain-containing protein [Gammaproteobacteria bacterium]